MNKQPDEILAYVLSHLKGIDLIHALKVCTKWKNLIETTIINKKIPFFEECVIDSDYYHAKNYLKIELSHLQKQLINLVNDKVFINHFEIESSIIYNTDVNNMFIHYSKIGFLKVVKYLVEKGADIHANNDNALIYSANNGHLEVVKFLVEKGADIHASNDLAFKWSATNGHLETVKYLVEKGADIHANNDNALIYSAHNGRLEIVKFLVEKGANIHACNNCALRWSAHNGHLEVVNYLIDKGANVNVLSDELRKKLKLITY